MKSGQFSRIFLFLIFCGTILFVFGCDFLDTSDDSVDPNDFNLPIRNQEYDLLLYNSLHDREGDFEQICKEYELETGIKIKNFSVKSNQDYENALKSQIESDNKPGIFLVRNLPELLFWEKEGVALDLSLNLEPEFKDFVNSMHKDFLLTSNDINSFGVPCGIDLNGYLVDIRMINDLVGEKKARSFLDDFTLCSYKEFEIFIKNLATYIKNPRGMTVILNKKSYEIYEKKEGRLDNLAGIFSMRNKPEYFIDSVFSVIFSSPLEACRASYQQLDFSKKSMVSFLKLLDFESANAALPGDGVGRGAELFDMIYKNPENDTLTDFLNGKSLFLQGSSHDFNSIPDDLLPNIRILPKKMPPLENVDKGYNLKSEKFNTSVSALVNSYFVINSKISKKEQKFALNFLMWLNTSEKGRKFIAENLKKIPCSGDAKGLCKAFMDYKDFAKTSRGVSFGVSEPYFEEVSKNHELREFFKKINIESKDYEDVAGSIAESFKNIKKAG
ncbi:MAG: extracellular solute-binding protein [Oscillospiraceae bacterium]|jgi:raffinose/stachyose/melibiose transport system substrate-binding protein|nr:extracellular solute-binding protein [Oscillospiraceae bacterium]